MDSRSNIPDRAEALEALDNGNRQVLAMWNEVVGLAQVPEPAPLDSELARLVASDFATAREKLIAAMVLTDANRGQKHAAELHMRIGTVVNEIDEMAEILRGELDS